MIVLCNETMYSLTFYLWFGFACIVFASRPPTKPTHYWSWPPQLTSRDVELNTLDLGRPMGATQWGSGTCILGPGLVPVLTMLEGFGSVYGLWVKITVARSNRKWGCQEEGVDAWVVYRKTHAQSFTSKFNTDINTLWGNKCEWLNQNPPFTFLSFLKFPHWLASLTHPSSTHPSLPSRWGRLFQTSLTQQHPRWKHFPLCSKRHRQGRWAILYCPSSKFRCTTKNPVQHA